MPNLQPLLDELSVVLDGKMVECPRKTTFCRDGKFPDQAYNGLREVVREHVGHKICKDLGRCQLFWRMAVGDCEGTGYITRSWENKLDGELEGALIKAVGKVVEYPAYIPGMIELFSTLLQLIAQEGDTREAAVQAVLVALKG